MESGVPCPCWQPDQQRAVPSHFICQRQGERAGGGLQDQVLLWGLNSEDIPQGN